MIEPSDKRLECLKTLKIPVWIFDVDLFRVVWANAEAVSFWNAETAVELYARDMAAEVSTTVRLRLQQIYADVAKSQTTISEQWTLYPNGSPQTSEIHFGPWSHEHRGSCLLIHTRTNSEVTDSYNLRSMQALMHTSSMISLYDSSQSLSYANPSAHAMMHSEKRTLREKFVDESDVDRILQRLSHFGECQLETEVHTLTGVAWHSLDIRSNLDAVTGEQSILISETDVSDRRRAQQKIHELAYIDALTGLPNRLSLLQHINSLIEDSGIGQRKFALMFLDLDRFKLVNDTLGHAVGDELLTVVATRLSGCLDKRGLVGRLGGDEFIVVLEDIDNADHASEFAQLILETLNQLVTIDGHRLRIVPSMGVCLYPDHGSNSSDLLQHADIAMYEAKSSSSGISLFEHTMTANLKRRLQIETDLTGACDKGEFKLFYQPRICARRGTVLGFEGLIRWSNPRRGLVTPAEFISIAEETGLILKIGAWVIREAMRQQRMWKDLGHDLLISVNISPKQFSSADIVETALRCLDETGCDPSRIEFEITETTLLGESDIVIQTLTELSAIGIRLALDDFGTGYSNLAYLQQYPLSCLKIDRTFLTSSKRPELMEIILQIGKLLQLKMVAEGVETKAQMDWLMDRGCDELQGFYFSRPMPATEVIGFLARYSEQRESVNTQVA